MDLRRQHHINESSPLHFAAVHGNTGECMRLIDRGYDVNYSPDSTGTPLHAAVSHNQIYAVDTLIKYGSADINIQDGHGCTPLFVAAQRGYKEVCEMLIVYRAKLNLKDKSGCTPLVAASHYGHNEVCELLAQRGANPNIKPANGLSALHVAVSGGLCRIAAALLKGGRGRVANVNAKEDENGYTTLHIAALDDNSKMCELLIKHEKTNINAKDKSGRTPLFLAAENRHVDVASLLAGHGADMQ